MLSAIGKKWSEGIDPTDKDAAFKMASAATAVILKRSLRNGSLGVIHSIEHRAPEHRLIPSDQWEREKSRFIAGLGVPKTAGAFLAWLTPALEAGLGALAAGVREGAVRIEDGRLVIPRSRADAEADDVEETRRALFDAVGGAHLPDILVEIDAATQFSAELLGRYPRSEKELVTLYAALLALGTDLTPASAARMIAGVDPKAVGRAMVRLIASGAMRSASDAVQKFAARCDVAKHWGDGATASADMMSLEASRHLWSTRADPRRRSFAVGTYAHVLDQWSIIYDQPIVLGRRQAGAAIEGALRHTAVPSLDLLAVDTHGHTHFAMALAKCCGFDLSPRLARLSERKLYLPRGFAAPQELSGIVSPSVSSHAVARGWDGMLRLASSVREGWCPATFVMDKFGSAARGDAVYETGTAVGKLLLTLYLCDYLANLDFQREIGRLLSQGESVHVLQRAINNRPLGPKAGREADELTAISNALTLIANIIIAWNTAHIQKIVARTPRDWPPAHLRHIAPVAHAHINLRGVMTFELGTHRDRLLGNTQKRNLSANI